jgi:hypothetical protein
MNIAHRIGDDMRRQSRGVGRCWSRTAPFHVQ